MACCTQSRIWQWWKRTWDKLMTFLNCWQKYINNTAANCCQRRNNTLIISGLKMWMRLHFHLNTVFTTGLERTRRIKGRHLNLQQSQESGRSSGARPTSSLKSSTKERAKGEAKNGCINRGNLIYWKEHTSRYQAEKLELEEKVAKSKATVKVFEELE